MKKLILFSAIVMFIVASMFTRGFSQWPRFLSPDHAPELAKDSAMASDGRDNADEGMPLEDDPWLEMEKLYEANNTSKGVSIQGRIKMIDANGPVDKTIEEQGFEFEGYPSRYHYRIQNLEIVNSDKINILADHQSRIIAVGAVPKKATSIQPFDIDAFRTMMVEDGAEAGVSALGDQKILKVYKLGNPIIQGYRIYYSSNDYKISKILIGGSRLTPLTGETETEEKTKEEKEGLVQYTYYAEMSYDKVSPLPETIKEFRPESKFVSVKKKKVLLTEAYKNYQLISSPEH